MATGCLSTARTPEFPGIECFAGKTYHTGNWPHEPVDFTGLRVGVIGSGSSAIQAVPVIARQAAQLFVFQRTPNFSIPSRNQPMTEAYAHTWKRDYPALRAEARRMRTGVLTDPNDQSALAVSEVERSRIYEERWAAGGTRFMAAFNDLIFSQRANDTAAEFVRNKIRATVHDPATAELLAPRNHPIGTKRICVDTDYYSTFNRDSVTLIDVRATPINEITARGLRVGDAEYVLDAIVFATGFDAMTGALMSVEVSADDISLRQKWEAGPRTYLGLMTAGFPNLFIITRPGSPSVLSNMIVSIEQHVDWITECLSHLRSRGVECIEASQDAEDGWVEHGNEVANETLYLLANSWYMGVNIPGKPQVFMPYIGGVGRYREICDAIAAESYRGFELLAPLTAAAAE